MFNRPETPLNFHLRACREGNEKLLKEAFAINGSFVGTDDSEIWSSEEPVTLLQQNSDGWTMALRSRKVSLAGSGMYEFLEFLNHKKYGKM